MIEHFSRQGLCEKPRLLQSMHEDRKKVFVDTLRWNIPSRDDQEIDQFDNGRADYLVGQARDGSHQVSVRLLDTECAHILGSIFPYLCDASVPSGPQIKEITRYLASPRANARERLVARNKMARALVEYGLRHDITLYTAVCDLSFLSQILAAGWRCDPLGMPQNVNGSIVGAFCIHIDADTIDRMVTSWRYSRPALALTRSSFGQAA